MSLLTACRIVRIEKRRDGGMRYWCLEHRADATAKYGRRATRCRHAHIPALTEADVFRLDVQHYNGGIALWGAVPPLYDTTTVPSPLGIHVHARTVADGSKAIDATYRSVSVVAPGTSGQNPLMVSDLDAIYYMVATIFGYATRYVECTWCDYPHLDKDWFSLHPHRRHLCAGCGRYFRDAERGIGNPIARVQSLLGGTAGRTRPATKKLDAKQADYPGGLQIWASNPAIVWTASRSEEEGIHVHTFDAQGRTIEDDTFSQVRLDGVELDPTMVRTLMAQSALPHMIDRVRDIRCPSCNGGHFDTGEYAFTPHELHECRSCRCKFKATGKLRKTIGNPTLGLLARLAQFAPRKPQQHESTLLVEAP